MWTEAHRCFLPDWDDAWTMAVRMLYTLSLFWFCRLRRPTHWAVLCTFFLCSCPWKLDGNQISRPPVFTPFFEDHYVCLYILRKVEKKNKKFTHSSNSSRWLGPIPYNLSLWCYKSFLSTYDKQTTHTQHNRPGMQSQFSEPPQLRTMIHAWLSGLRNATISSANTGPYPNYPLPPGFPYCEPMLKERFQWTEHHVYHDYTVFWQLHHSDLDHPAKWTLTTGAPIPHFFIVISYRCHSINTNLKSRIDDMVVAQVELDSRLLSGAFMPGMDFIVQAMLTSVKHHSPVRISSRPSRSMKTLVSRHRPQQTTEVVEMRYDNGCTVRELFRQTLGWQCVSWNWVVRLFTVHLLLTTYF